MKVGLSLVPFNRKNFALKYEIHDYHGYDILLLSEFFPTSVSWWFLNRQQVFSSIQDSPQYSSDLNNAVVWILSFSLFPSPLLQWITLPTQSCLVLYSFCAFAYYVIDRFVFITS